MNVEDKKCGSVHRGFVVWLLALNEENSKENKTGSREAGGSERQGFVKVLFIIRIRRPSSVPSGQTRAETDKDP